MEHQDVVDRLIMLKAVSDYFGKLYEEERKAYTEAELDRTRMPRGDESSFGTIVANYTKPEKGAVVIDFVVENQDMLMADRDEDAMDWFRDAWWPAHKADFARDWFYESGAVLDGCATVQSKEPDKAKEFKYFTVRLTKDTKELVSDALRGDVERLLPGGDA